MTANTDNLDALNGIINDKFEIMGYIGKSGDFKFTGSVDMSFPDKNFFVTDAAVTFQSTIPHIAFSMSIRMNPYSVGNKKQVTFLFSGVVLPSKVTLDGFLSDKLSLDIGSVGLEADNATFHLDLTKDADGELDPAGNIAVNGKIGSMYVKVSYQYPTGNDCGTYSVSLLSRYLKKKK